MPIILGFTINPVISEQLTDHRKGAALGGLSTTGFAGLAASPSNSSAANSVLVSMSQEVDLTTMENLAPNFLDLSSQYTHCRFWQRLSRASGCSVRGHILARDSLTYMLRDNCAVRRATVAGA